MRIRSAFAVVACSTLLAACSQGTTTVIVVPPSTSASSSARPGTTSTIDLEAQQEQWMDSNRDLVKGAMSDWEKGMEFFQDAEMDAASFYLRKAGEALVEVTSSPDGGELSDQFRQAGELFIETSDSINSESMGSAMQSLKDGNEQLTDAAMNIKDW